MMLLVLAAAFTFAVVPICMACVLCAALKAQTDGAVCDTWPARTRP